MPFDEIGLMMRVHPATYSNWKRKYCGRLPDELRRLKLLKNQNWQLKKNFADLTLDYEMLQDVIRRKLSSRNGRANWAAGCAQIG